MLRSSREVLNSPHCFIVATGIEKCNSLEKMTLKSWCDKPTVRNSEDSTLINSKRLMIFGSLLENAKAKSKASIASQSCFLPQRAIALEI